MRRVDAMAGVAQAVINIDAGITTIEKGSWIYQCLVWLCEDECRKSKKKKKP